jgi:predicted RNA-binding Zn-ribbon protein involved in translation (DUF1610 family)
MPGIVLCMKHREYYRLKSLRTNAMYRQKWAEEGRCVRCAAPLDPEADGTNICCINCREHIGGRAESCR